jgi:ribosomal protein L40E
MPKKYAKYAENMQEICRKCTIKYAKQYARNMTNMQIEMTNMQCCSIMEKMQENMQNAHKYAIMPKICRICTPRLTDAAGNFEFSAAAPAAAAAASLRQHWALRLLLRLGAQAGAVSHSEPSRGWQALKSWCLSD